MGFLIGEASGSLCQYLFLDSSPGLFSMCLFILSYPNMLGFVSSYAIFNYYPLEDHLFSNGSQKGINSDGRKSGWELGGVEGDKTLIRIYYERGKPLFSIKLKIRKGNNIKASLESKKTEDLRFFNR